MTLDIEVQLAADIAVTVLIATLIAKRILRQFPLFFCYLVYVLCTGLAGEAIDALWPRLYLHFWIINAAIDAIFTLLVLAELGRNLLRHNRKSSPGWSLVILLFIVTGLVLHTIARLSVPSNFPAIRKLAIFDMQTAAVVLLAAFLTLVLWSGALSLRWPDRELRIASGIGFCAIVGLIVAIIHSYPFDHGRAYHWIDLLLPFSYVGVLFYWIQYFAFEDRGTAKVELPAKEVVCAGAGNEQKPAHRTKSLLAARRATSR